MQNTTMIQTDQLDLNFRKLFPHLDRVCGAALIREVFQTSKRDAAGMIANQPGWLDFFKNLESRLQDQEKELETEIRRQFTEPSAKDEIVRQAERQKMRRKFEKGVQERIKALELCKEIFMEVSRDRGQEVDPSEISLDDVEKMLRQNSGSINFQEQYGLYMAKVQAREAKEHLDSLVEKGLLQVKVNGSVVKVTKEQVQVDPETQMLTLVLN